MAIKEKYLKIPEKFVYEIIDGKTIYFKGYNDEEIWGGTGLQSTITTYILEALYSFFRKLEYRIHSNHPSLQIDFNNILTCDILIYDKTVLTADKITTKYSNVPPKYAIEVDTNADLSESNFIDYLTRKTEKLFEFGTEKVFWGITASQKVIVAQPNEDWYIRSWDKDIELFDGININIGKYLDEEGIKVS